MAKITNTQALTALTVLTAKNHTLLLQEVRAKKLNKELNTAYEIVPYLYSKGFMYCDVMGAIWEECEIQSFEKNVPWVTEKHTLKVNGVEHTVSSLTKQTH